MITKIIGQRFYMASAPGLLPEILQEPRKQFHWNSFGKSPFTAAFSRGGQARQGGGGFLPDPDNNSANFNLGKSPRLLLRFPLKVLKY